MKYLTLLFSCLLALSTPFAQANSPTPTGSAAVAQDHGLTHSLVDQQMQSVLELLNPLIEKGSDKPGALKSQLNKLIPQIKRFSEVTVAEFKGDEFYVEFSHGVYFAIPLDQEKSKSSIKSPLTLDKSTMQNERLIEQQMNNIKALLNPLMLEDNPKAEFKKMVPQVKGFSEVKKAEFKGNQFYVEFSNGSVSYWDLPK